MKHAALAPDLAVSVPRRQSGYYRAARCLAFGCVLIACMAAMLIQALREGHWVFWVSNFVFFGVLVNSLVFLRARHDLFEPVVLVCAILTLAFALRGIFLHFGLAAERINPWVLSNLDLLGRMNVYMTAGFALFCLGYYSSAGHFLARRLPRIRTRWDMAMLGPKAIRVYCLCLPLKLLLIVPQGTFPLQDELMRYLGNVIGLLGSLADVALILYGIYYYKQRSEANRVKWTFYTMLTVQLVVGLFTGYREPLLISLMAVMFVRNYVYRRLKPAWAVAAFLAMMFAATPLSRAYRYLTGVEHQTPLTAARNLPREVVQRPYRGPAAYGDTVGAHFVDALFGISHRFHGADSLIACMATTPDYLEFQKGKTLYLLPVSIFVPRAIWADKPKIGLGTFFRDNIWRGPISQSPGGGQIAMSQLGELYINFGMWGIMLGMLVLGVFHRFVYCYLMEGHDRGNFSALLFYFAAVICFLAMERNFAFAYGYLCKLFLFIYILCRYLNRGPVFSRA